MSALQVIHREFAGAQVELLQADDGELLMTSEQLGIALGFGVDNAAKGIAKVYERNVDELREHRLFVKLTKDGVTREVTCWKREAIYAFGFLARTPRSVAFRRWATRTFREIETGDKVVLSRPQFDALVASDQAKDQLIAALTTTQQRVASFAGSLLAEHGHRLRKHPEWFGLATDQRLLHFYEAELVVSGDA